MILAYVSIESSISSTSLRTGACCGSFMLDKKGLRIVKDLSRKCTVRHVKIVLASAEAFIEAFRIKMASPWGADTPIFIPNYAESGRRKFEFAYGPGKPPRAPSARQSYQPKRRPLVEAGMDEGKVCHDLVILELWHDE
jgi:hypothetical protein